MSEEELAQTAEQERRRIFAEMEEIRFRISESTAELTQEEVYRLAGFSEEVIAEVLALDAILAAEQKEREQI